MGTTVENVLQELLQGVHGRREQNETRLRKRLADRYEQMNPGCSFDAYMKDPEHMRAFEAIMDVYRRDMDELIAWLERLRLEEGVRRKTAAKKRARGRR